MIRTTLAGILCTGSLLISYASYAEEQTNTTPSYMEENNPDGWFFYKDKVKPEPIFIEPIEPTIPPPADSKNDKDEESEEVEINSAWLRKNLPKLLDAAQDNPTYENVRRYMYAQRIALDKSTEFAMVYTAVSQREVALNEALRRPSSSNELQSLAKEISTSTRDILRGKRDKYAVFFFFSSDCPYCKQSVKVIDEMYRKYNMDILPVSLNGQRLNVSQKVDELTVFDDGTLTDVMPVEVTPTFYLMNVEDRKALKLSAGYLTSTEFVSTTLRGLRELDVITERDFQATKQVKDILLTNGGGEGSKITVNEEELYENPDYLADKLRKSFNEKYLAPDSDHRIQQSVSQPPATTNTN